jgi:small subunit ribosomal protein S16
MVVIRLARGGANKRPFHRVVVTDSRNPRDGRYIERLGYFNPKAQGQDIPLLLKRDRIEYWVGKGAKLSDRVQSLVKQWDKQQTV